MTADNREKFQQKYQAGQQALERGQYRLSIENLSAATELVAPNSRQGGEAQIWLVTAYQAAHKIDEAIALAQDLVTHPDTKTREQAQRILYIIKAPVLKRPQEWMSEIPDLTEAEQSASRYVAAKKQLVSPPVELELEDLEPSPPHTQDNQFVWFALVLVGLIMGSLLWLGRA
ncbi:MAG: outer membrane protein assembly factor BamD [Pleurocapsa sp.]